MTVECVECPICESKIQLPPDRGSLQCICPNCKHPFDIASSLTVQNLTDQSRPNTPVIRPSPESQVDFANPIPAKPLGSAPADSSQPAIQSRAESLIHDKYRRHQKRKNRVFAIVIAGLVALIGIFAGIFVRHLKPRPGSPNVEADRPLANIDAGDWVSPALQGAGTGDEPQPISADPVTAKEASPPAPPRYFSFRKSAVEDCWKKTRPHLISLEIDGPLGKRFATGTLVDSRGWIVTSYQAVKDAWNIRATAASEAFPEISSNDIQVAQPLTDLVRGFIATDPANDLALLSVNRRFVVSFADVPISSQNHLVQGEYLLQLGPPSPTNYYGKSEVKIENRSTADQLDREAKSKAVALGLDLPTTTWLTTRGGVGTNPGMPLFRINGTLVAITSFTKNEYGYALPVHSLAELIRSADGTLTALKPPMVRTASGSEVSVADDSPARKLVVKLNQSAKVCAEFDWLPTDRKQYAALQAFSMECAQAHRFVEGSANDDDLEFVIDTIDRWQKSLRVILIERAVLEPQRFSPTNQFASQAIKKGDNTPVIFFGSIHAGGLESTRVILKFNGSETFASIPFPESGPVMRPGTKWIFFLQTMPLSERKKIRLGNTSIPTYGANFQFAIGPIE